MSLIDTGRKIPANGRVNALAKDGSDKDVIVSATEEAIEDYGWGVIWAAASGKYDSGDVHRDGPKPKVMVSTLDCEGR